jgi:hypothetical protein
VDGPRQHRREDEPEPPDAHEFLLQSRDARIDPVDVMRDLRAGLADLPDTAATFKPKRFADHPTAVDEGMLVLCGAWPVPDVYPAAGGNGRKWVNPHNDDAYLYADAVTRCVCGAILVREQRIHGETIGDSEHDHTDDCRKQWRLDARARLAAKRREILLEGYWHRRSGAQMSARLGCTGRDSVGPIAQAVGVDAEAERQRGAHIAARTMGRLLECYPPRVVGDVYGLSGEGVRATVRRHLDADPGDLHERRKRLGNAHHS